MWWGDESARGRWSGRDESARGRCGGEMRVLGGDEKMRGMRVLRP